MIHKLKELGLGLADRKVTIEHGIPVERYWEMLTLDLMTLKQILGISCLI